MTYKYIALKRIKIDGKTYKPGMILPMERAEEILTRSYGYKLVSKVPNNDKSKKIDTTLA